MVQKFMTNEQVQATAAMKHVVRDLKRHWVQREALLQMEIEDLRGLLCRAEQGRPAGQVPPSGATAVPLVPVKPLWYHMFATLQHSILQPLLVANAPRIEAPASGDEFVLVQHPPSQAPTAAEASAPSGRPLEALLEEVMAQEAERRATLVVREASGAEALERLAVDLQRRARIVQPSGGAFWVPPVWTPAPPYSTRSMYPSAVSPRDASPRGEVQPTKRRAANPLRESAISPSRPYRPQGPSAHAALERVRRRSPRRPSTGSRFAPSSSARAVPESPRPTCTPDLPSTRDAVPKASPFQSLLASCSLVYPRASGGQSTGSSRPTNVAGSMCENSKPPVAPGPAYRKAIAALLELEGQERARIMVQERSQGLELSAQAAPSRAARTPAPKGTAGHGCGLWPVIPTTTAKPGRMTL